MPSQFQGIPKDVIYSYAVKKLFTRRQIEVLTLLLNGYTNVEIGRELNLKQQVIKNYLKKMFDKAGIKNRVSLVADVYDWYIETSGFLDFLQLKS